MRFESKKYIVILAMTLSASVLVPALRTEAQERVEPAVPGAQATPSEPARSDSHNPAATDGQPDLQIGSGDLLQVSVYGAPDYDRQVRVSEKGTVSLPLLGVVKIAGLTISDAEELLQKQLVKSAYFTDPQVSILVKEYNSEGVSVMGEVQKPGIYPLLGRRSLLDAISAAGGTTTKAGDQVSITHRSDTAHPVSVRISSSGRLLQQAAAVQVLPGDTIVVAKAGIVYVVGDVRVPGGFIIDKPRFTVLQAIAMAQGVNPTAAVNNASLIRTTPQGQQQQTPLKLAPILSAKAPDIVLQPDDIVFVPNSPAKSAFRKGLEVAVQTASGIAIYRR